jgi:hypothetical protein
MSASTYVAEGVDRKKSIIRVIGSSLAGTSLEWYDHAIYGSAAALVFPKLFFPQSDPLTGTLLSMTIYGVGFLSRPVGDLYAVILVIGLDAKPFLLSRSSSWAW